MHNLVFVLRITKSGNDLVAQKHRHQKKKSMKTQKATNNAGGEGS